uniref:Uncharacterized protein n=1 Tax=Chlamydomonas euryale TaxID=1486919 RepID=A0A7R9VXC8_9CHLO|mmetsp:Transcript_5502/g.16737  ORF Transcript_5502/g.16737 Transcript_5502/m.16737 type:complete len:264 (+) Transcript_5502:501-1292(+)|eukprot:365173-Chlamydomonas_euryale.AAC.5
MLSGGKLASRRAACSRHTQLIRRRRHPLPSNGRIASAPASACAAALAALGATPLPRQPRGGRQLHRLLAMQRLVAAAAVSAPGFARTGSTRATYKLASTVAALPACAAAHAAHATVCMAHALAQQPRHQLFGLSGVGQLSPRNGIGSGFVPHTLPPRGAAASAAAAGRATTDGLSRAGREAAPQTPSVGAAETGQGGGKKAAVKQMVDYTTLAACVAELSQAWVPAKVEQVCALLDAPCARAYACEPMQAPRHACMHVHESNP